MSEKLRVLDLFSGIGGFSLGLERTGGFETVAFCEIEEFPRRVLAKHWPNVPQFEDVRKLNGGDLDGAVDVICGGYPCQPFSTAGKRRGKEDDRHLWPEFMRLVAELRPTWVIGENVAGHISMGLDDVLSDLEGEGYACRTFVVPACAVGAHHRRDRCWTVANSGDVLQPSGLAIGENPSAPGRGKGDDECKREASQRERVRPEFGASAPNVANAAPAVREWCGNTWAGRYGPSNFCEVVSNSERIRQSRPRELEQPLHSAENPKWETGQSVYDGIGNLWATEPDVGRVADGVPGRVDRLKALGNAVVPQIPEMIGNAILKAEGIR